MSSPFLFAYRKNNPALIISSQRVDNRDEENRAGKVNCCLIYEKKMNYEKMKKVDDIRREKYSLVENDPKLKNN